MLISAGEGGDDISGAPFQIQYFHIRFPTAQYIVLVIQKTSTRRLFYNTGNDWIVAGYRMRPEENICYRIIPKGKSPGSARKLNLCPAANNHTLRVLKNLDRRDGLKGIDPEFAHPDYITCRGYFLNKGLAGIPASEVQIAVPAAGECSAVLALGFTAVSFEKGCLGAVRVLAKSQGALQQESKHMNGSCGF